MKNNIGFNVKYIMEKFYDVSTNKLKSGQSEEIYFGKKF